MDVANEGSSPLISSSGISSVVGELKIKGQAEVERRKNKWEKKTEEEDRVSSFALISGL